MGEPDYWVINDTPEDENLQPITPAVADTYLYIDEGQDPYNEDGTSKSWSTFMTSYGTVTVLHNRMS